MNRIIIVFLLTFGYTCYSQIEIKANKDNGIFLIPCKVNGVPLTFVFDTGASQVSISITEAKFLLKNGLLKEEDVKESVRYQIASGEIKEGTEIILREIEIEGYIINDISATIVYEQNAPLLLGLSALNKIGKVILENGILKIIPLSVEISNEKLFVDTKSLLLKALNFKDENTETKCLFKDNFFGLHTKINMEEPDYEYYEMTSEEYILNSKKYAFLQTKIIIQNNQVYVKRLESSGIEVIAYMFDYSLNDKENKLIYAVSTQKLIDLGPNPNQEAFEKILIKQ